MNANEFGARSMRRIATSRDELLGCGRSGCFSWHPERHYSNQALFDPPRGALAHEERSACIRIIRVSICSKLTMVRGTETADSRLRRGWRRGI